MQTYYAPLVMFGCCTLAVARLAGKVGGLTEVFFTGLRGALPAPKCRAGGLMGRNGVRSRERRLCAGLKMRLITLIALLLFTTGKINATPELDVYTLQGKHVTISVVFRYHSCIQRLFYTSLLENLDSFAEKLKQTGKLERGKINFQIMTGIWMDGSTGVIMYRYRDGYFCWLNGLVQPVTQDYLAKIISYFASDNWQSFVYDYEKIYPDRALQIFNQRIDTINITHQFNSKRILELNSVAVNFENGSLLAKNITDGKTASSRVYGVISNMMPFSAGSLDFVTIGNTIYVIENGLVINQYEQSTWDYYQPHVEVFPKWVNFTGRFHYFLSYSIENNRFYKINERF